MPSMSSLTTPLEGLGLVDDQSPEANTNAFLRCTLQDCGPIVWDWNAELSSAPECNNGLALHTRDETSRLPATQATACIIARAGGVLNLQSITSSGVKESSSPQAESLPTHQTAAKA